ncbi:hypothetical protein FQV37_747 [Psychrobacter nivimaris]|uniref:Uncharacterized protein n=1 Tax=Psychrobacter nivimaris TaxID=281738 RepID=A0A6N7BXM2_9GAMM|nr:hypothetical protein FQV37_747 [Psychrobacter nivimaris]
MLLCHSQALLMIQYGNIAYILFAKFSVFTTTILLVTDYYDRQ